MASTLLMVAIGAQSILSTWDMLTDGAGPSVRRRVQDLGRATSRGSRARPPARRLGAARRRAMLRNRLAGASALALAQYIAPNLVRGIGREVWNLTRALSTTVLRACLPSAFVPGEGGVVDWAAWAITSPILEICRIYRQLPWGWISLGTIPALRALPSLMVGSVALLIFLVPRLLPAALRAWDSTAFATIRTIVQDHIRPLEPQLDALLRPLDAGLELPPQAREALNAATGPLRTLMRGASPAAEAIAAAAANVTREYVPAMVHRLTRHAIYRLAVMTGIPHEGEHVDVLETPRRRRRSQAQPTKADEDLPPPYEASSRPVETQLSTSPHPPGHLVFSPLSRPRRGTRLGWAHRPDFPLGEDFADCPWASDAFRPLPESNQPTTEFLTTRPSRDRQADRSVVARPFSRDRGSEPEIIDLVVGDQDEEVGGRSFAFQRASTFIHSNSNPQISFPESDQGNPRQTRSGRAIKRGSQPLSSRRARTKPFARSAQYHRLGLSESSRSAMGTRPPPPGGVALPGAGATEHQRVIKRSELTNADRRPTTSQRGFSQPRARNPNRTGRGGIVSGGQNTVGVATDAPSPRTRSGTGTVPTFTSTTQASQRQSQSIPKATDSVRAGSVRRRPPADPPQSGHDQPPRQRRRVRAPHEAQPDGLHNFIVADHGSDSGDMSYEDQSFDSRES